MKQLFVLCAVLFLFASCDVSSVFDELPDKLFPEKEGKVEYTLQDGNSLLYFGFPVETVEYENSILAAGGVEYNLADSNSIMLMGGFATVIVSGNCITLSIPGQDSLLYVSL